VGSALSAVSCVSSIACTAVGYSWASNTQNTNTLAEGWNGTTWSVQATVDPSGSTRNVLSGVSCWQLQHFPFTINCEAVGSWLPLYAAPLAEGSSNGAWSQQSVTGPSGGQSLASISCLKGQFFPYTLRCEAVGSPLGVADDFDGSSWTQQTPPYPYDSGYNQLNGVACGSLNACVAVGFNSTITRDTATVAESFSG
jgi:hypothetical protein